MTDSKTIPGAGARRAALDLLDRVLRRGLPLDAEAVRLPREDDRRLALAIAGEALRWLPDLDALIDGATAKPLPPDAKARGALRIALAQALRLRTPPHAAIATVLPLVDGGPRRLVHGVFGTLLRNGAALPEQPTLPSAVAERWRAAWGEAEVGAARALLAEPPPLDVALKPGAEGFADAPSLLPGHRRLPRGTAPAELPGYADGDWWVQDAASQLPARLLGDGGAGHRVLDLCAAPGGKAMQLAAAGWRATAVDASENRLARLRDNLARTGLEAEVVTADVLRWEPREPADAVLLDAPCSATGTYRRHPDVLHRVRPRAIAELAEAQGAMLARAAEWVRPGGRLVYAVCSLEPEEGEAVAKTFLWGRGDYRAEPPAPEELPAWTRTDARGFVRVLPSALAAEGGADGFFFARFRRAE